MRYRLAFSLVGLMIAAGILYAAWDYEHVLGVFAAGWVAARAWTGICEELLL